MSCITAEEGGDSVPEILPGFSFCPSDKVLVGYYLKMKIEGNDSKFRRIIPEIDLYKLEPSNIPAFFKEPDSPHHDREWIFFTRPDRKYTNSNRCNRASEKGFYKITGKERDIQAQQSEAVIGKKRTLTFYQGRMPGAKRTDWGLNELSLCKAELETGPNPHQQRDFVVCRLSLRDKSANCKSGNKKLKDDLICDEITDSGNGSYVASNSGADQAASTDMISEPVQHLPYNEPGECTESPNDSWLTDNVINDISTKKRKFETIGILCDDDESFSDFDSPAANKWVHEFCAELGKILDSPPPPQPTPQPPGIGDNNSYPAHKSKLSTNGHNEPVSDIANSVQDRPTGETSLEVYNYSTDYRKEPVSNTAYNHIKGAADERVSEAYFLPEDILRSFFHPFDPQDWTLTSPMTGELGDVKNYSYSANKPQYQPTSIHVGCSEKNPTAMLCHQTRLGELQSTALLLFWKPSPGSMQFEAGNNRVHSFSWKHLHKSTNQVSDGEWHTISIPSLILALYSGFDSAFNYTGSGVLHDLYYLGVIGYMSQVI